MLKNRSGASRTLFLLFHIASIASYYRCLELKKSNFITTKCSGLANQKFLCTNGKCCNAAHPSFCVTVHIPRADESSYGVIGDGLLSLLGLAPVMALALFGLYFALCYGRQVEEAEPLM